MDRPGSEVYSAVEVPAVYPVSLPFEKVANDEGMGRIASDVLMRGDPLGYWLLCSLFTSLSQSGRC